jgi:hypothetical protein
VDDFGLSPDALVLRDAAAGIDKLLAATALRDRASDSLRLRLSALSASADSVDVSERIAELSRDLRVASGAGCLPKNSAVARQAVDVLQQWKQDLQQRERLDAELRAVVDYMRSLEGINRWFGQEAQALGKLDAALARYGGAGGGGGAAAVPGGSSTLLRKVATTMRDFLLDCKHKRQSAERRLAAMLSSVSVCRVSDVRVCRVCPCAWVCDVLVCVGVVVCARVFIIGGVVVSVRVCVHVRVSCMCAGVYCGWWRVFGVGMRAPS